jgi:hypothetical protein
VINSAAGEPPNNLTENHSDLVFFECAPRDSNPKPADEESEAGESMELV